MGPFQLLFPEHHCHVRLREFESRLKRLLAMVLLATLASPTVASAQESPALDPDWIELQPKETFFGRWANQFAGAMLRTVKPFTQEESQGVAFISGIDTFGLGSNIEFVQPTGARRQDPSFSLFGDRSILTLSGLINPEMIPQADGSTKMVAKQGALFLYNQNDQLLFDTERRWHLSTKLRERAFGEGSDFCTRDMNNDGMLDVVVISKWRNGDDSSVICWWDHPDLVFRDDTTAWGWPVIPATYEYLHDRVFYAGPLTILDLDLDGILDIVSIGAYHWADTSTSFLTAFFGKHQGKEWQVDTTVTIFRTEKVVYHKSFDFLYSDGRPDLLVTSNDTIFCFTTKVGFMRRGLNFDDAELKIPAPSKLDPIRFLGNGRGKLWEYGYGLFDAGNVNGSGDHSLGTFALYVPDTASAYGISYCMLYSGGKAADERIDALFGDNSRYAYKDRMDTVRPSNSSLTDMVVADPTNTIGRTGRVDYIKGSRNIPHKPDPRWTKAVAKTSDSDEISLHVVSIREGVIELHVIGGTNLPFELTAYDVLGRIASQQTIHSGGADMVTAWIDLSREVSSAYVLVARSLSPQSPGTARLKVIKN